MDQTDGATGEAEDRSRNVLNVLTIAASVLWLLVLPIRLTQAARDEGDSAVLLLAVVAGLLLLAGLLRSRARFFRGLVALSGTGFILILVAVFLLPFSSFFVVFVAAALILGALGLGLGLLSDSASRTTSWLLFLALLVSLCVGAVGAALTSEAFVIWVVYAAAVIVPLALVPRIVAT